jgi:hypothetical protein
MSRNGSRDQSGKSSKSEAAQSKVRSQFYSSDGEKRRPKRVAIDDKKSRSDVVNRSDKGKKEEKKSPRVSKKAQKEFVEKAAALIPVMQPSVVRRTIALDTDNPVMQLIDITVLEHALYRPVDFSQNAVHPCPAGYKGYLMWAFLTAMRKIGALQMPTMADVNAWPAFPDDACIPNSIYYLIQYLMPYEEFGAKGEVKVTLNALPTGTQDSVGAGGAGLFNTSTLNILITPITDALGAANEFVSAATGAVFGLSLLTIQQNWEVYSKMASDRGSCHLLADITSHAPDGSAYTFVKTGNTDMVNVSFKRYREDLATTFADNTITVAYDVGSSPAMSCFTVSKIGFPDGTGTLTHGPYVKARNEYVWYAQRNNNPGPAFVPSYNGKKLSTFIGVIRQLDLFGYKEMCVEFLKYYAATNALSLTSAQIYEFLLVCELGLMAQVYKSGPHIFCRGWVSGGVLRDQLLTIFPGVEDIKFPGPIADYLSCLALTVNEEGVPFYFKVFAFSTTKFGYLDLSVTAVLTDYSTTAFYMVRPFATISGPIDYSPVATVTWNAAFLGANPNALIFPQKWLNVILDRYYALFTSTGMDICVLPENRIGYGGICTQVAVTVDVVSVTGVSFGVFLFGSTTNRQGMGANYPVLGSELSRALTYAFIRTTNAVNMVARFGYRAPSRNVHLDVLKMLFTETVQKQGSFAVELARLRDKTNQMRTTRIGHTGELATQPGSEVRPFMDRLFAMSSEFLQQAGNGAKAALLKVGNKSLELLKDEGLDFLKAQAVKVVGAALFM